jgi:hypothetical protein
MISFATQSPSPHNLLRHQGEVIVDCVGVAEKPGLPHDQRVKLRRHEALHQACGVFDRDNGRI